MLLQRKTLGCMSILLAVFHVAHYIDLTPLSSAYLPYQWDLGGHDGVGDCAGGKEVDGAAICPLPTSSSSNAEEGLLSTGGSARIAFSLRRDVTYNNTFNLYYRCGLGNGRVDLNERIKERTGVLDFVSTVMTDLKILIMGDSVGIQIFQGFDEACGGTHDRRNVIRYSWGTHEGVAVSPARGGGVIASWRITGMLLRRGQHKAPPNSPGGGWIRGDVDTLLNHTYSREKGIITHNRTIGSFDAMMFRIPHGWVGSNGITKATVTESIVMAYELFGVETLVLTTIPFSNNVQTREEFKIVEGLNAMIRDTAYSWMNRTRVEGVKNVLVMEYGNFIGHWMEANAAAIGYDTTVASNYLFDWLSYPAKMPWSIPLVCAEKVENTSTSRSRACTKNYFSLDGMHLCMETVGARIFAVIACLLGCAHNRGDNDDGSVASLMRCQLFCNDQFMSLQPADQSLAEKYTWVRRSDNK